jgi:hypothetical protein
MHLAPPFRLLARALASASLILTALVLPAGADRRGRHQRGHAVQHHPGERH